jgi:two-component system, NarL family, response regulator DegU
VSDQLRCLLVDDQPLVRLGMRRLLQGRCEVEEAPDGDAALELVKDTGDFDVAVVEMRPPRADGKSGTTTIKALLKAQPGLGIVALGKRGERHAVSEALDAGAKAYLTKRSAADHLERAIHAAADSEKFIDPLVAGGARRGTRVTRRQQQILQLIANGDSTATVARRLGLSTETVKTHTKQIFARLEARDRAHAVAIALRSSLIE